VQAVDRARRERAVAGAAGGVPAGERTAPPAGEAYGPVWPGDCGASRAEACGPAWPGKREAPWECAVLPGPREVRPA